MVILQAYGTGDGCMLIASYAEGFLRVAAHLKVRSKGERHGELVRHLHLHSVRQPAVHVGTPEN
ncbi:hypothetical protein K4749_07455 [Streptomyces sp. TRM72054]|uniref:hypothetical protein n=1 Tax=Streptomyces sp. TRM72054 TaxID=2870562 RepID=UPI001C8C6D86|nr:hypothetical protein [Streptomyces sp. TRM72054]MBX9393429.1 hypothetical protein [Streptomyces sp. TRM72054]